jgi:8-oxo-dGTP diphosphatase
MTSDPNPSISAPRVGVGVIVLRDGLVLLGQRQGAHGAGSWALPGGHLEYGESPEQCARREAHEETGLDVDVIGLGPYTNDVFSAERRHYVTLFVLARSAHGEPQRREPGKCARWQWCRWRALPTPVFQPLQSLLRGGYAPPGVL